MSLTKYIEKKEKKEIKLIQVEIEKSFYETVRSALDKDGLTMKDIVTAGLRSYMSERKDIKKKLNGKS